MESTSRSNKKLSELITRFKDMLSRPVDAIPLGCFRLCFGVIMLVYVLRYRSVDILDNIYLTNDLFFTYPLFDLLGLPDPSGGILYYVVGLMGLSALFIAAGLFFRVSLVVFLLSFGYMFLIDKTHYNNHYYLIMLLTVFFLFTGADRFAALDNKIFKKKLKRSVPYWHLFIFQIQICIVYFFGAVAKMNLDWISGRITQLIFMGASEGFFFVTAFAGLAVDLFLAFALMIPSLRQMAIFLALAFNVLIKVTLNIGIFPYLMIASCILFIAPKELRKAWQKIRINKVAAGYDAKTEALPYRIPPRVFILLCAYLVVQFVLPFRHLLYKGPVEWNQRGDRFAWRMFAHENYGHIDFFVTDLVTGETLEVPRLKGINVPGYIKMSHTPDMILQYARYLKQEYKKQGMYDPVITVNSFVSRNGRPFSLFINPELNLGHPDLNLDTDKFFVTMPTKWTTTKIKPTHVGLFYSSAYQLAVIDGRGLLPGDHPRVKEMQALIDEIAADGTIHPIHISNLVAELKQSLEVEYGRYYEAKELLVELIKYYKQNKTLPDFHEAMSLLI